MPSAMLKNFNIGYIINILHSKYLLAKSKYRIYHIFLDGGYMSRGYFAWGLLYMAHVCFMSVVVNV